MNMSDYQSFLQLFDRMEADSSLKGTGRQLACISKLVFYCGVKEGEIPELTIRDVIDKDGKIIVVIRKFDKPITLTDELEECIVRHIKEMGSRNPSFVKRRSLLFTAYPNTKKIKRHLKSFGTTYTQIHHAGIHYYYRKGLAAGRSKGWIYESGSRQKRISIRQFQAVVTGNKIPAGVPVDNRCVDEIMMLLEKAEGLDKSAPNASESAHSIMERYEKYLNGIRSDEVRERYDGFRSRFVKMLKPYLK
jgi:hypothetical protein